MTQPVIDDQVFAELQDTAGADFVVELVDTFLEDAPQGLAAMRAAVAAGDAEAWRRHAHSLKSNAVTFGATALADAAREAEHAPPDAARIEALTTLFDGVAAALKERRHA